MSTKLRGIGEFDTVKITSQSKEAKLYTQVSSDAIQGHLDAQAKVLRHAGINAIGKYLGYNNVFRVECEELGKWASSCWVVAEQIEADVIAGNREMPTVDETIAELPAYTGV